MNIKYRHSTTFMSTRRRLAMPRLALAFDHTKQTKPKILYLWSIRSHDVFPVGSFLSIILLFPSQEDAFYRIEGSVFPAYSSSRFNDSFHDFVSDYLTVGNKFFFNLWKWEEVGWLINENNSNHAWKSDPSCSLYLLGWFGRFNWI